MPRSMVSGLVAVLALAVIRARRPDPARARRPKAGAEPGCVVMGPIDPAPVAQAPVAFSYLFLDIDGMVQG